MAYAAATVAEFADSLTGAVATVVEHLRNQPQVAAGAVLLYAATRGRQGDLSETEQHRFYARALVRSVPRSLEVLAASRRND